MRTAPRISADEWDFRGIRSDWELPFATLYEYSRSSQLHQQLQKWFDTPFAESGRTLGTDSELLARFRINRSDSLKKKTRNVIDTIWASDVDMDHIQRALVLLAEEIPKEVPGLTAIDVALRFPCFPKPWLSVKRTMGPEYLERRSSKWIRPSSPLREAADILDYFPQRAPLRRHEFVIDWSADAQEIKKSFVQWLGQRHPATQGRRRVTWERLKWLSAYRVAEELLNFRDAKLFIQQYRRIHPVHGDTEAVFPFYSSQTAWGNAIKRAKESLGGDFHSEILRDVGRLWIS